MRHTAARGATAEEDIAVVTVGGPMGAGFRDTTTEATIILEDITEAIIGTTIEDMPLMEQPLDFSLVG